MRWDGLVDAPQYLMVKSIHVGSSERGVQGYHLIDDTACGPKVTLEVIRFVFPDLWAAIVWGSGLCVKHGSLLGNLGDIQISELDDSLLGKEQISAFNVSVADLEVMQCLQSSNDLYRVVPQFLLREISSFILMFGNQIE